MKFPRNARIFKGQLDAAPFVTVLFLLVIFLMLGTRVYTPGVRLELPGTDKPLPGTDKPTLAVAIDADGRLYFDNRVIEETRLLVQLRQAAKASAEPLTLLIQADKAVSHDRLVRLGLLAREAGIPEAWLATLPPPMSPPSRAAGKPH